MNRLVILLAIALLVLSGCGGGAAESNGGGGESESQSGIVAPTSATAKGTIEYNQHVEDEIMTEDDAHAYEFAGAEGDEITVRIGATGSAFTAPYFFVYDPDGELLANSDTESSRRSARETVTLETDGTYTVVVQPFDGNGIEGYELVIETQ